MIHGTSRDRVVAVNWSGSGGRMWEDLASPVDDRGFPPTIRTARGRINEIFSSTKENTDQIKT